MRKIKYSLEYHSYIYASCIEYIKDTTVSQLIGIIDKQGIIEHRQLLWKI